MAQTSPDAEGIFNLIISTFTSSSSPQKLCDLAAMKSKAQVSDQDWDAVLAYSAQVLSNLANFKSFGAVKFIPRCSPSAFRAVVAASEKSVEALKLWDSIGERMWSVEPEAKNAIGKPCEGHLSAYYPDAGHGFPSDKEVDEVQAVCDANGVSTLNTR